MTVTADVPLVDQAKTDVSTNITPAEVENLPLNGRDLGRNYITYADIVAGGKLVFYMSDKHA